jgi:uncharacterized protein (DUF433 family)
MNEATVTTPSKDTLLTGVGLYSLSDAAHYIRRSSSIVGKWVIGRPTRGEKAKAEPGRTPSIFVTPPLQIDGENVLTFEHLIELRMIDLFRHHNVSVYTIKAAAQNLARILDTKHPFSSYEIKTDGKRIFGDFTTNSLRADMPSDEAINDKKIAVDLHSLQTVMGPIVELFLKDTEYVEGCASRWWLLDDAEGRAILDPARNFGQPIDEPTGVPLSPLYSLIKAGETIQSVSDWYDVPPIAVETAMNFYRRYPMF